MSELWPRMSAMARSWPMSVASATMWVAAGWRRPWVVTPGESGLLDEERERPVVRAWEHELSLPCRDDEVVVERSRTGEEALGGLLCTTMCKQRERLVVQRDAAT